MKNKFVQQFTCEEDAIRLDRFLVGELMEYSRTKIQKLIEAGEVLVNGEKTSKHFFLSEGDIVQVDIKSLVEKPKKSGSIDLQIVHDDKDFVVVNKPAGVIVHQFADQQEYTLADELVKRYPEIKTVGEDPMRPGIVHRLDKNVSGLMVIAKTQEAFEHLKAQFQNRSVEKEYMALVDGKIENKIGEMTFRVGRSGKEKHRMAAFPENSEEGKEARSSYEVIDYYKRFSLVRVKIETGRTHQIRVHMQALGHPVIGDVVYGKKANEKTTLNRIFLHSYKLAFNHPVSGEKISFEIPLPLDLKKYLNTLTGRKKMILISAPSGSGKTTLVKAFLDKHSGFGLTTTYTTREKRSGTSEDKIMHNVSHEEFEKLRDAHEFLEWAEFNGNYYATHKASVLETLKDQHIVVNIDVQGAHQILQKMPEVYTIFIDVDDSSLKKRLKERGDVSDENIIDRVENIAPQERTYKPLYDVIMFNKDGKLDEAIQTFEKTIKDFIG